MQALIKSVELKKFLGRYYFKITLIDVNGYTHVINRPFLNSPIHFRRQVFGIMSACGSYDLMRLATENPISKKVTGYYLNKLIVLENDNNEWFYLSKKEERYVCKVIDDNDPKREIMRISLKSFGIDGVKASGFIKNIRSASGIYSMFFDGDHLTSWFLCDKQIYWGFGDPITIGNADDKNEASKSAKDYQSFIVSLMEFYGINDLLLFGGKTDKLPIVELNFDNDMIVSITNPDTGLGFSLDDEYKFINIFDDKKKKVK